MALDMPYITTFTVIIWTNVSFSFIHRTDFIITGSCDGHIKFWKKLEEMIEFVKHFRSHLGAIQDLAANSSGTFLCSVSSDKSLKVFDVINFGKVTSCKFYTTFEIQILQRNRICLQVSFFKNCSLLFELKYHRSLNCLWIVSVTVRIQELQKMPLTPYQYVLLTKFRSQNYKLVCDVHKLKFEVGKNSYLAVLYCINSQ